MLGLAGCLWSLMVGYASHRLFSVVLTQSEREKNSLLAEHLLADAQASVSAGSTEALRRWSQKVKETPSVLYSAVYDAQGHLLITVGESLPALTGRKLQGVSGLKKAPDHQDFFTPIVSGGLKLGMFHVQISLAKLHDELFQLTFAVLLGALVLTLVMCWITVWLLYKNVVTPVRTLRDGFERLSQNAETSIQLETDDEFEELAMAFNALAYKLSNRR